MRHRPLSPDEAALWARVMAGVRPIAGRKPTTTITHTAAGVGGGPAPEPPVAPPAVPRPSGKVRTDRATSPPHRMIRPPANTLDGSWDRQLSRGLVSPDRTIDLHGHTLHSAYDMLDAALDAAIRQGDRVILLVTGKPPRPASDRPLPPNSFRGAIRAATGDWLAGSRHASAIAAVRPAHPRHGGAGALYIVLRRPR